MNAIELTDISIVKLRPCKFVKENADRFGIVRRAGINRIVVRGSGLEACRQFRNGSSVAAVKAHLARQYRTVENAVDLRPLLRTLQTADLIASVDGEPVQEACPPSIYSAWRYYLRFHLKAKLLRAAYGAFPANSGKRLAYWAHRLDLSASLRPKALRAATHVKNSPAVCRDLRAAERFAGRYLQQLIQNIVDFESAQAMSPGNLSKWLDKNVEYEGLQHLVQAKNSGKPVMIAGFHFSTTKLLALMLMRIGFDAAQLWMPDGSVSVSSLREKLAALKRERPEYGTLDIIPDFTLASYKRLLKLLSNGTCVVWFADMFGVNEPAENDGSPEWREAAARLFAFGQMRMALPQSRIDVELCGQKVRMNPWIGGFARISNAAVVPAAVVRENSRFHLKILPALHLPDHPTSGDVEDLNRKIFGQLDLLLRRYPEQWFGWHSLCPIRDQNS